MSNEVALPDMLQMATAVSKSGLFNLHTPDQVLSLMLIAQAEGLHPAVAARDYDIIQGKPALKSRAMLARFQRSGGKIEWTKRTDREVSARFSHPSGGSIVIDWDMARAKQAGLDNKAIWKQYPRQMMSARVISEGVNAVYPDATGNFYTPEEVADFDAVPPTQTTAIVVESRPLDLVVPPIVASEPATKSSTVSDAIPADKIDAALRFLVGCGWIKEGDSLAALSEKHAAHILRAPAAFLKAIDEKETPVKNG